MTFEDLWKVQRVGRPALSPDGRWVAVEVTSYDMDEDTSSSQLWVLDADGSSRKQLTFAKGKNSGPAWAPDGKSLAFIAKRSGDVPQIFVIHPDGGEARQLTEMPMAPSGRLPHFSSSMSRPRAPGRLAYSVTWQLKLARLARVV